MTSNANATAPAVRPSERVASLAGDIRDLWDQSVDWFLTHYLQIGIALAAGVAIVAALYGLRMIGARLCREPGYTHWRTIIGRAVSRTHLWFMVALAAAMVSGIAQPPAGVQQVIQAAFTIAAAFQAAIWAREIVLGAVEHRAGGDTEHGRLGSAMGIIRLLVTFGLFAIAIVLVLDNLGVNVTGLIAGLGIGGIAIGLAAQGIFADLFAALAIIFDKPFRRGDSVRWDGTNGSVESIGLKSTRVRSITGEQIIISNKNLLDKELHNLANLDRRRMSFVLSLTYETPVDVLERVPAMIREIIEAQDKCKLVRCGLTAFAGSSVDFEVQFDVMSQIYDEVYNARSAVGLAIMRRFNEEGIPFAYPTQTNYTAAPDGTIVNPVPDTSSGVSAGQAA
ncbi:mechanosensitive ion channel family protein [Sphingomonas jatrophae]|uniref:Small-conductance mechanosensitive channel n=1 Tax=Sphingomonas jatrophae TaxID=1166337 RepID=A0A1I6LHJ2_9SPHN|nr:mechanosensitive ion channel family protein [Sphingomonas jatrophae]SFS02894.1 Small-conductance mechanosensitive channel [Sphingomonas jatrophae]